MPQDENQAAMDADMQRKLIPAWVAQKAQFCSHFSSYSHDRALLHEVATGRQREDTVKRLLKRCLQQ